MNDFDNNKLFAAERFHVKNKRKFIGMNSDTTVRIGAEFFHHGTPLADDDAITGGENIFGSGHRLNTALKEIIKGKSGRRGKTGKNMKFIAGETGGTKTVFTGSKFRISSGGGIDQFERVIREAFVPIANDFCDTAA
nr:MAG TPA: hypothetical protein [Caudoviricetes sp.]